MSKNARPKMPLCISLVAFWVLSLSSCIEITQYAGAEKGKLLVDTRFVFQKAIFEMAKGMGGGSDAPEISDIDLDGLRSSLPPDTLVSIDRIDSDLEAGVAIRLSYASASVPSVSASSLPLFLPYRKGQALMVDISAPDSAGSADDNAMAAAILAGFKYRLMIDRSVIPDPKAAFLVSDSGAVPATLVVYPSFSVVEVSMGVVLGGGPIKLVVE